LRGLKKGPFMGMILHGVQAEAYDRTYSTGTLVARLVKYFRPYIGQILLVALCLTLFSVVNIAVPVVIARGIDSLETAMQMNQIVLLTGALFISGTLVWVFNMVRQYYTTRI